MKEDEDFIRAYSNYRKQIQKIESFGKTISYDWISLPSKISIEWFAFTEMLKDHARELANSINQFLTYTIRLIAWLDIIENYDDKKRFYLVNEFIDPIAIVSLNLPYAIRSRFMFSVTHLCHQANRVINSNWKDNLPNDRSIDFKTMDKFCNRWEAYEKFKKAFIMLSDRNFNSQLFKFRNKFHHRFPPHIELGLSQLVTRSKGSDASVRYGFGGIEPLSINKIVPLLKEQCLAASSCFSSYQDLVNEQIENIFST